MQPSIWFSMKKYSDYLRPYNIGVLFIIPTYGLQVLNIISSLILERGDGPNSILIIILTFFFLLLNINNILEWLIYIRLYIFLGERWTYTFTPIWISKNILNYSWSELFYKSNNVEYGLSASRFFIEILFCFLST